MSNTSSHGDRKLSTLLAGVIGLLLAGATVAGIATAASDKSHHKTAAPAVTLYGQR